MTLEIKHSDRKSTIFSVIIFLFVILFTIFLTIMFITEELLLDPSVDNILILIAIILTIGILVFIMMIIIIYSGEKITFDNQGIFIKNSDINFSLKWSEINKLSIIETFRDEDYSDDEGNPISHYKREMKLVKTDGNKEKLNFKFSSKNIETEKIVKIFNYYLEREVEITRDEREYENYDWTRIHYDLTSKVL